MNPEYKVFYDLARCPLCRGVARLIRRRPLTIHGEDKHVTYVKCRKCYAKSGFFILEEYESHEEAWADAVRHWNTRADWIPVGEQLPDTPHEQTVEIDFDEYEIDLYSDEVHIYDEIEGLVRGRLYLEGSNHRPLWADVDGTPLLKVTHWAPMLKKPPVE